MSKNKNGSSHSNEKRVNSTARKSKSSDSNRKNRQKKQSVSGFSTLNQVAGVPKRRQYHSEIPVPEAKSVREPEGIICPFCNMPIDSIASAVVNPDGTYSHFDCVLNSIRETEKPAENQTVSYIGSGNFALCEKNENGGYTILKRISYEAPESHKKLVDFVGELKE